MDLMKGLETYISGETYFFRDHGQFDLLRLKLLPELIDRHSKAKSLRLWSAGCSSGEEAYSLAMLVDMLLPERGGWKILIIGSDIDPAALAKARQGCYGQWSFRMVPPAIQARYFRRTGNEWTLDESIRRMVTFRSVDLIDEPFPGGELRNMDLILCRNVFIYLKANAVTAVSDKLAGTLGEGGYLMTGHAELTGLRLRNMQSRLFAESIVYQRVATMPAEPPPVIRILRPPAMMQCAPSKPPPAKPNVDALLETARKFADRGEYDQAEQACHRVLAAAPLAAMPHLLLAQLAQLKGNFERAVVLLEKTLYLDPGCVAATLELAALFERARNLPRARALKHAALDTIRALPHDATIEPYEMTAGEMARRLAQ